MSLLTHRLVFLCVDAYCFIFWDLPGDVQAAPASALCGLTAVILFSPTRLAGTEAEAPPDDPALHCSGILHGGKLGQAAAHILHGRVISAAVVGGRGTVASSGNCELSAL